MCHIVKRTYLALLSKRELPQFPSTVMLDIHTVSELAMLRNADSHIAAWNVSLVHLLHSANLFTSSCCVWEACSMI